MPAREPPAEASAAPAPEGRSDRLARWRARLLPRGPRDLVLQLLLIAGAYTAWRYARGAVDGDLESTLAGALAHGRDLVSVEESIGLLFEVDLQRWAIETGWPAEIARWGYANLHFNFGVLTLLTVYFWRPASYPFLRNMVIAAMAISLLGYALYPTAPPRFLPELGLDGSESVTGNEPLVVDSSDPLYNPVAAVPSMHVGLAIIFAWTLAALVGNRFLKALLLAYPLIMSYVVIASGNHYWLDAVFGAVAAALALGIALLLARLNPAWSLRPPAPGGDSPPTSPEPEAATA